MLSTYIPFYKKQIYLSFPIILGQLTTVLIAISDNVMIGNYNNLSLSAAAFANSIIFTVAPLGMGLIFGLKPLVVSALTNRNPKKCARLLQNGFFLFGTVGILMALTLYFATPLLHFMGQEEEVTLLAQPYFQLLALSIIPWFLFMTLQQFAEAFSKTKIPMFVSLISCGINILLNYVLIFGKFGFPELGLVGAGWATLIARSCMFIMMACIFFLLPFFRKYINHSLSISMTKIKQLSNIGVPIGLNMVFESGAFAMSAIMAGWISPEALAAHQIALNIAFTTFMVAVGLAQGTTVNVANLVGNQNLKDAKTMGRSALVLVVIYMFTMATLIMLLRNVIPWWYINDSQSNATEIYQITIGLLFIAGVFQLADGVQVISAGNLRGLEDTKVPSLIGLLSYWVIGIPGGYLMAFHLNFGVSGIWWGLCLGLMAASILLTWRFETSKKLNQQRD